MKIRDQMILSAVLFGVMLLVIAVSVVTTTAELDRLDRQVQIVDRIGLAANDLNYLSSEYLLYGEPQQLDRWERRYASLDADISNLSAGSPDRQALITAIGEDRGRLKSVFDDVLAQNDTPPQAAADPATLRVSWSRIGVQTQGLAFDAERLEALLHDEADRLKFVNTLLISALLGTFAAALLINYLAVGRRTLRSLSTVLDGASVIGSGDLEHEIAVNSDDEIGELSRAFNLMTADLRTVTASRADLEREVGQRTLAETRLRASLAALEQKEAELQSVALFPIENPAPVLRVDDRGRLLSINPAGIAALGDWHPEIGGDLPSLLSRDIREAFMEARQREVELRYGSTTYSIAIVPIPEQHYVNLYLSDITERKRAEESLLTYAHAIDTTYDAIFTAGPDMVIRTWNVGAERLFGYTADEVVGSTTHVPRDTVPARPAARGGAPAADRGGVLDRGGDLAAKGRLGGDHARVGHAGAGTTGTRRSASRSFTTTSPSGRRPRKRFGPTPRTCSGRTRTWSGTPTSRATTCRSRSGRSSRSASSSSGATGDGSTRTRTTTSTSSSRAEPGCRP